jgi:hypothetical protein
MTASWRIEQAGLIKTTTRYGLRGSSVSCVLLVRGGQSNRLGELGGEEQPSNGTFVAESELSRTPPVARSESSAVDTR